MNYIVTKKEILAFVQGINKFQHYITGYEVFIHTDHSTSHYLMKKTITNGRITRWFLLLREFNITIVDRTNKENIATYFLSRINNKGEITLVDDIFSDEHLFVVSTHSRWFAYITNYLAIGRLPQHFSSREKQNIVMLSATYSLVGGNIFHTGPYLTIQRCVQEDEMYNILKACHDDPCGGYFPNETISYKVFNLGHY